MKRKHPTIQYDDDKFKEAKERIAKYLRLDSNHNVIVYTPTISMDMELNDFYLEDNQKDNDNFMNVYWKPASKDDGEYYLEALQSILADILMYELEIEKGNFE